MLQGAFDYKLGEDGMFEPAVPEGSDAEDCLNDVLLHLWVKRDSGATKTDLVEAIDVPARKLSDNLTQIGKDSHIRFMKKRWWITGLGLDRLALKMPELADEIAKYKESTPDTPA